MKRFFLILWQLPQFLIGDLVLLFIRIDGVRMIDGRMYVYSDRMKGGISFGNVIILSSRHYDDDVDMTEKHEYGHSVQSLYLGWLYLVVIGIPSLLWAAFYDGESSGYYRFYTERWADRLGGVERK